MEQRTNVARDTVLTCVVLHNILKTHQGGKDRTPTPAEDIAAIANKQEVYLPDENHRNLPREAQHQKDLLKDYLNNIGALA